jgi:hypothetical protein
MFCWFIGLSGAVVHEYGEIWNDNCRGKIKVVGETSPQVLFVRHKSRLECSGIETALLEV